MDNIESRIFLKTLYEIDKLSGRALSLCTKAKLYTLNDIKLFYEDYGNFFKFKNCGEIINNELCLLCEIELNLNSLISKPVLFILDKYDMLLPEQKSRLHDFLILLLSKLPPRLYNGIVRVTHNRLSPENVILVICHEDFNFKKIQNIGEGSLPGFKKLKSDIINSIEDLLNEEITGINDYYDEKEKDFWFEHFSGSKKVLKELFDNNVGSFILLQFDKLSALQKSILHEYIKCLLLNVSARTKNVMATVINLNDDQWILKAMFAENLDIYSIKHAGEKSRVEYSTLKNKIGRLLNLIASTDEEELANSVKRFETIIGY